MKIIVTGGAGFIGSHVADAYYASGHRVVVIDNLSTGKRANVGRGVKLYAVDVRDQKKIDAIFKRERPEIVNHHTALVSVVDSVNDPASTLDVNVLGTVNLLRAFGAYGRGRNKRFIFASSGGAVYGDAKHIPTNETAPLLPLSPYGLSKLLAEDVVRFYGRLLGFPHTILRYANVYGPRQVSNGEGGVVPLFRNLIQHGGSPTIFGDGTKARDYVYVSDIARANTIAVRKGRNETINIGTGKLITDDVVLHTIARAMHSSGKPRYAPYREGEVYHSALDARKARRVLGWMPRVPFEEGIQRVITR